MVAGLNVANQVDRFPLAHHLNLRCRFKFDCKLLTVKVICMINTACCRAHTISNITLNPLLELMVIKRWLACGSESMGDLVRLLLSWSDEQVVLLIVDATRLSLTVVVIGGLSFQHTSV